MRYKGGRFHVNVWEGGWPIWTEIEDRERHEAFHGLDTEDVRQLHYLLGRAVAELDRREQEKP